MTPLEDAQAFVLESCPPSEPVMMAREQAGGLVLADVVMSTEIVPPFNNTAVDGYAVRSVDVATVPVELTVVGEIAAGAAPDGNVGPGETIRIMTGAPMPPGADAVVMVEYSERLGEDDAGNERVRLNESVAAGTAIRGAGDDVVVGEELFFEGTQITPAIEGVLASINAQEVRVYPRLKVAVLSTGDELITDGSPLAPGQIRESNKIMLAGMLAEAGCQVVDIGVVRDDEVELERVLRAAAVECDAIVSSGGVSMGDYDVVKAVLGRIADMTWMQMAIKPAKPFAFGKLDGVPVFGLPGNPVSSMVSFELMARPALRRMMGHTQLARTSVVAIVDHDLRRNADGKVHFMRVNGGFAEDGRYHVAPVNAQGSHQLAATASADAMAVVPDGDGNQCRLRSRCASPAVVDCSNGGDIRTADRSIRSPHRRSQNLRHRPLQLPLHLLHARGGHAVAQERSDLSCPSRRSSDVAQHLSLSATASTASGSPAASRSVRARLPLLVSKLSKLVGPDGPVNLAMTTNGATMRLVADSLKQAGLKRVNISLDTLDRTKFHQMTRRDELNNVLDGIRAAQEVGFDPVKINAVIERGTNDNELIDLATFGREQNVEVRFIEFMPLDAEGHWMNGKVVGQDEIVEKINAVYPVEVLPARGAAPADRFRFLDGGLHGEGSPGSMIGVIPTITKPFCGDCDRVRLTAEGDFRTCLFATKEFDLLTALRSGESDDQIADRIEAAVAKKWAGHQINQVNFTRPSKSMSQLGG